ncbi:MAG: hypothetical protein AB9897_01360 [Anaerolineaceae bacterium]
MNVFLILLVTILLAFLIETLVEAFVAPFFNNFPKITKFKWMQMYIAMIVGITSAFIYHLDLVSLLSQFLGGSPNIQVTTFGLIITGCAMGRGSNYLHDLVTKFFTKSNPVTVINPSSEDSTTG